MQQQRSGCVKHGKRGPLHDAAPIAAQGIVPWMRRKDRTSARKSTGGDAETEAASPTRGCHRVIDCRSRGVGTRLPNPTQPEPRTDSAGPALTLPRGPRRCNLEISANPIPRREKFSCSPRRPTHPPNQTRPNGSPGHAPRRRPHLRNSSSRSRSSTCL
jgi:hypothetical protein